MVKEKNVKRKTKKTSSKSSSSNKKDKDVSIVKKGPIKIVGDYNGQEIKHLVKMLRDNTCQHCGKSIKGEICYREISSVGLLLGMNGLTEIYLCCKCALKKGKTRYGALIQKS